MPPRPGCLKPTIPASPPRPCIAPLILDPAPESDPDSPALILRAVACEDALAGPAAVCCALGACNATGR